MTGRESVIADVDVSSEGVCVWWVSTDPGYVARLCGAWVVPKATFKTLEPLVFGRMVLATESGRQALKAAKVKPERVMDLDASLAAARAELQRLQTVFETEQASRPPSKRLRPPRWPALPEPLDIENPPPWDDKFPDSPRTSRALCIAHWLWKLCMRWSDLEDERLARPMLRALYGAGARPIPVVLA